MSEREILPYRRPRAAITFEHSGHTFTGGFGYYPDSGKVGEVFISAGKPNSARDIDIKDAAIAASLALQYGCPIETLRKAFLRNPDGTAAGPMGQIFDLLDGEGK